MNTTNVKPADLNYDSYENKKYDEEIRKVIPGYKQLHQVLKKRISSSFSPKDKLKILDLGVGTGLTLQEVLTIIPLASATAVDFSATMLRGAQNRLRTYKVTFVQGDYTKVDLGNKNKDLVISVIGIHHQNTEGKKKVFFKIYSSLKKGGIFLFGDLVTYKDKYEAAVNEAKHYAFMVEHLKNELALKEWSYHHKYLNDVAPLEDQIKWLQEAGFASVKVEYKFLNTVLITAKK